MPFSKNPTLSTYSTKQIKLLQQWEARDKSNSKDIDIVNCIYEIVDNKKIGDKDYTLISRDGTTIYPYTVPSSNIRGTYYWRDIDRVYIAYDTSVAVVVGSTGVLVTTVSPGFAAGTTDVGFTEFNYDSGLVKLVVSDGTILGTIDVANAFVATVSPNIPIPHDPHVVFLDGYVFLLKTTTADIYNSNLNNPLLYTTGNFIYAEMLPDNLIRIERLNNYLVAFGSASIEYFYDAANATGSPLQRNDTPVKLIGYLGGLASWGNKLVFVGQTQTSSPAVYLLEDFKMDMIDTPPLRRYIEPYVTSSGAVISIGGLDFYVLNVGVQTHIMDLNSKLWTRLQYQQQTNFPIRYAVNIYFNGYGNTSLLLQTGLTTLNMFRADTFLDNGVDYTPTLVTDNDTFDSFNTKFGRRLTIQGDRTIGSIAVSWTDNDYQTYSTPRTIVLDQVLPVINSLGSFRRRAFKFVHSGNCRMRIEQVDLDINMGIR